MALAGPGRASVAGIAPAATALAGDGLATAPGAAATGVGALGAGVISRAGPVVTAAVAAGWAGGAFGGSKSVGSGAAVGRDASTITVVVLGASTWLACQTAQMASAPTTGATSSTRPPSRSS